MQHLGGGPKTQNGHTIVVKGLQGQGSIEMAGNDVLFMQYMHSPWWWWGGGCGGTEQDGWLGLGYIRGVTVAGS